MKNEKLINLRYKYGLTQKDIATKLNITKGSYSQKENGRRKFNTFEMGTIFSIFRELDPKLNMQDIFLLN